MRVAITEGFRGSIESMKESCGLEPHDVVHMMMVTHYLDVLKDFAQVCVCVCLLRFWCVFLYVFSPSSHFDVLQKLARVRLCVICTHIHTHDCM